jgi:hypothetical protein
MKPFHLKQIRTYLPPYSKELQEMLNITKERTVVFETGVRGFILGNHVLAPHCHKEDAIAEKDGQDIPLMFEKTCKYGISRFLLPYDMPVEPLSFRQRAILKDTFLFRVFNQIHLCSKFTVTTGKGIYGLDSLDQFCPVFDRHAHLIGMNSGIFCKKLICIPVEHLV